MIQDGVFEGQEEIQAGGQDFGAGVQDISKQEVMIFKINCDACGEEGDQAMSKIDIPHFKQMIILSFTCQACGNHDAEIKNGGEITDMGRVIILNCRDPQDLNRQVYKSDTACLEIPEVELELQYGTLGGAFTTVQGLIKQILSNMRDRNPFCGDEESFFNKKMNELFDELDAFSEGLKTFTLIIRDPVDNSFIDNPHHPLPDKNVKTYKYKRSAEDDDFLGIDTMKTD